jgi:hypothetical protein
MTSGPQLTNSGGLSIDGTGGLPWPPGEGRLVTGGYAQSVQQRKAKEGAFDVQIAGRPYRRHHRSK